MEATVLSVGKSVVSGAVSYAQSAVAKEVALQLGVQRDQAFIRDELEMMQSFLMAAQDERDDNKVVQTWVKQVRDLGYDVEDCLQDFVVRFEKSPCWWRILRTLLDRRHVAMEMKDLRAKVEDVSQRNLRYHLIRGTAAGSKSVATAVEQYSAGSKAIATMFGVNKSRRAVKPRVHLAQLINKEQGKDLRVIVQYTMDFRQKTAAVVTFTKYAGAMKGFKVGVAAAAVVAATTAAISGKDMNKCNPKPRTR